MNIVESKIGRFMIGVGCVMEHTPTEKLLLVALQIRLGRFCQINDSVALVLYYSLKMV